MKFFIFLSFLILSLQAKEINPSFSFFASGGINDIKKYKNNLYLATSSSSIDIFDLNKNEIINTIKIPKIKDFTNKVIDSKVFSVDAINDKILILSQGESGGRDIFIEENGILENIINSEERLFIAYAKFLDENKIIYSLLSNQIFIYDLKEKKILKELHISYSSFSHFVLSDDLRYVFVADESGTISKIATNTLEIIKEFNKENVDRVFKVDYKNSTILASGQDRRAAIYFEDSSNSYHKSIDFLVYSGALNNDASKAAISYNENNDILVFDVLSQNEEHILKGNNSLITSILFLNNYEIVVASDDKKVNIFNLKE
ncbi:MAG TPA: WD40 repeat domain-containing protein [Aliarcobacter thereius]|nr:WD40 repeat domain-containing protein [Aliarcobacter thereius]HJE03952.1 WD40 repeat domain-containing protein [Aliarcobacter thereius]